MKFGATCSIAYTSLSARFRSLLGMWVAYIMFTVLTCGETLLSSTVQRSGLLLVVAVQPLVLVFVVYFESLFKYPAVSIGVVGWLVRGAMNLARAFKYAVQTGRSLIVSYERLFPLTGFGSSESGLTAISSLLSPLMRRLFLF